MMTDKREEHPLGRFEIVCEAYIYGTDDDRNIIITMLPEHERQIFLEGCGLYRLLTDERYYNAVQDAIGEYIYRHGKEI